ncbi:cAMP phosphodiesterase [Shigella dysenteriae]|nr:cAMP phosphodiesterase [Shigella dysenteriae]
MAALALEQEKKPSAYEQLIQFDPMTGLPNRNNLHNYLDDLVDKAVSPVVYLIGVDHIQDVIDSLGYAWADQHCWKWSIAFVKNSNRISISVVSKVRSLSS